MALFVGKGPISGKEGDIVYARNRYGQYTRPLRLPVNPKTEPQETVRTALAILSQRWADLDGDERTGWKAYADNVAIMNRVGQPIHLTAHAMFVRCNLPRLAYVEEPATRSDAPTEYSHARLGTPQITFAGSTFTLVPSPDDDWTDDGGYLFIYATPPHPPTRNFPSLPFTHIGTIAGNAQQMTVTYPWQLASNKCFLRLRASAPDARLSPDLVIPFQVA